MDNYPLNIKRQENNIEGMSTRADLIGRPIEIGKSALTQKTSLSDSIHLWNRAPKNCLLNIKQVFLLYQPGNLVRL